MIYDKSMINLIIRFFKEVVFVILTCFYEFHTAEDAICG